MFRTLATVIIALVAVIYMLGDQYPRWLLKQLRNR